MKESSRLSLLNLVVLRVEYLILLKYIDQMRVEALVTHLGFGLRVVQGYNSNLAAELFIMLLCDLMDELDDSDYAMQ